MMAIPNQRIVATRPGSGTWARIVINVEVSAGDTSAVTVKMRADIPQGYRHHLNIKVVLEKLRKETCLLNSGVADKDHLLGVPPCNLVGQHMLTQNESQRGKLHLRKWKRDRYAPYTHFSPVRRGTGTLQRHCSDSSS